MVASLLKFNTLRAKAHAWFKDAPIYAPKLRMARKIK
jgi:hypothetical protein